MAPARLPDGRSRCAHSVVTSSTTLALLLARWLEARLHDSCVPPSALHRSYALDIIDPDGLETAAPDGARVTFLDESVDPARFLAFARADHGHDAVAWARTMWLAPTGSPVRPGEFAGRRRARLVSVVIDGRVATVARYADQPDVVVVHPAA